MTEIFSFSVIFCFQSKLTHKLSDCVYILVGDVVQGLDLLYHLHGLFSGDELEPPSHLTKRCEPFVFLQYGINVFQL